MVELRGYRKNLIGKYANEKVALAEAERLEGRTHTLTETDEGWDVKHDTVTKYRVKRVKSKQFSYTPLDGTRGVFRLYTFFLMI